MNKFTDHWGWEGSYMFWCIWRCFNSNSVTSIQRRSVSISLCLYAIAGTYLPSEMSGRFCTWNKGGRYFCYKECDPSSAPTHVLCRWKLDALPTEVRICRCECRMEVGKCHKKMVMEQNYVRPETNLYFTISLNQELLSSVYFFTKQNKKNNERLCFCTSPKIDRLYVPMTALLPLHQIRETTKATS